MSKPAVRMIGRIAAATALCVLAALGLCLDTVEYRPYFTTPYYKQTVDRLAAAPIASGAGMLSAGFGRALLSPTLGATHDDPGQGRFRTLPLAGFGNRKGRPATGVHDDLYVKAIMLSAGGQTGVLVSADALIVPREVAESACARLERDLNLKRAQIYFSATHTHSGPGGWGEGMVGEAFAGGFQPGVRVWWVDRIVAAVRNAMADAAPAELGGGTIDLPAYVRNRLVGPLGRIDSEFQYMVIRQTTGAVAVVGSYAAHATVLSGRNMEMSADYPGFWQRAVERATGGTAMFLAGGVGSHGPVPGGTGFGGAERMGEALAKALLDRLPETAVTNRVRFGICGAEVMLPPLNARVTDGIRLRPWLAARLLPVTGKTFVQGFRLGNRVWISTPCDFSGELALAIKNSWRTRGLDIAVTSFNGDYIGYVVSSRYYHLDGYEPRLMSFFGPNVPEYLSEIIDRVIHRLAPAGERVVTR